MGKAPHQGLCCSQILLFSSVVVKELHVIEHCFQKRDIGVFIRWI